jgi:hypothetical protein
VGETFRSAAAFLNLASAGSLPGSARG